MIGSGDRESVVQGCYEEPSARRLYFLTMIINITAEKDEELCLETKTAIHLKLGFTSHKEPQIKINVLIEIFASLPY